MLNIVENVWTVGGQPQTPLGELKSAPPDPLAGREGTAAPPHETHPTLGLQSCPQ